MDAEDVAALKALVDPLRLRLVGLLAARAATADELGRSTGVGRASLDRALAMLRRAGLTRAGPDGLFELDIDRLNRLGHQLDRLAPADEDDFAGPDGHPPDAADAKVLRAFIEGGRLTEIPAQASKRLVVLRYLAERCFTEDRPYPEKEVNQRLALFHPDVASLRRYLVDAGLMTRAAGEYRRTGP